MLKPASTPACMCAWVQVYMCVCARPCVCVCVGTKGTERGWRWMGGGGYFSKYKDVLKYLWFHTWKSGRWSKTREINWRSFVGNHLLGYAPSNEIIGQYSLSHNVVIIIIQCTESIIQSTNSWISHQPITVLNQTTGIPSVGNPNHCQSTVCSISHPANHYIQPNYQMLDQSLNQITQSINRSLSQPANHYIKSSYYLFEQSVNQRSWQKMHSSHYQSTG